MSRPLRLVSLAVLGGFGLLLAASCRAPQVDTPLFDALHRPLVLTESQRVGWPASNEPNRFLQGWWDFATKGPPRLAALERARIQGVKLGDAGKALRITATIQPESTGSFEARVSGRKWKSFPLARRIQIPIPKNTPAGRFTVDFRLPDGAKLGVRRAEFLNPQPAGRVTVENTTLVQSGFSLVETVRRLESATVLSGRFRPPNPAAAGQHFAQHPGHRDLAGLPADSVNTLIKGCVAALYGIKGHGTGAQCAGEHMFGPEQTHQGQCAGNLGAVE